MFISFSKLTVIPVPDRKSIPKLRLGGIAKEIIPITNITNEKPKNHILFATTSIISIFLAKNFSYGIIEIKHFS